MKYAKVDANLQKRSVASLTAAFDVSQGGVKDLQKEADPSGNSWR